MDQKQIAKQMFEFGQAAFNSAYDANTMFQDQVERVTSTVLDQSTWLPPESRKAIDSWMATYRTGRTNFKKYVDDSYKQAQELFAG
jgi:hypothetical protein